MLKIFLTVSSLLIMGRAAPAAEEVVSLPQVPSFDFKLYSGFLPTASKARTLHYFGALSKANNPTDPVIIYISGDVGCSSLVSLASETGPFTYDGMTDSFVENPNSWNKQANVFYVETIASQGYSNCVRNLANPKDFNCVYNDLIAANDLRLALTNLMTRKFPEFLNREVYFAGNNYAGVLLPQLGLAIEQSQARSKRPIDLEGIMIEDGKTAAEQF